MKQNQTPQQAPQPLPPHPQQGKPKKKMPVWAWILIGIAAFGIIGAALNDDEKQTVTKGTVTSASTASEAAQQTTAAPETEAATTAAYMPTVGDTVTVKNVDFKLVSADTSEGEGLNMPDEGMLFFLPLFEITNNSDEEINVSSVLMFDAYVDDESAKQSISATMASPKGSIDGKAAPGKRVTGVYGFEVPEDWQVIEIHVKPGAWSRDTIIFTVERP